MKNKRYTLSDFDYLLPNDRIALHPARPKDSSKLMVLRTFQEDIIHDRFIHLDKYLPSDALLVLNDTKVFQARVQSLRASDRRLFEFLFLSPLEKQPSVWKVLVSPLKRIKKGDAFLTKKYAFPFHFIGRKDDEGLIEFTSPGAAFHVMEREGLPPLPPYIQRKIIPQDKKHYQTIYAKNRGSSAAPTAGLHFTRRVFDKLLKKGIKKAFLTLHVGRGTFSPVREEEIAKHILHSEWFSLSEKTCRILNEHKKKRKPVCTVGTTTLRALETVYSAGKRTYSPHTGETSIFLYPPQKIKSCDCLLTNFHLPKSTLLMLVCAFGGYELIMKAYREAVQKDYRFYSYGDAMLILK